MSRQRSRHLKRMSLEARVQLELARVLPANFSLRVEVVDHERRHEALENAFYSLGDLHRLAGRAAEAESAYRRAAELGREVQPGLALLRRDAGRRGAARAGVARALEASPSPGVRAELLTAQVDLETERGDRDVDVARSAVAELRTLADEIGTEYLRALAL